MLILKLENPNEVFDDADEFIHTDLEEITLEIYGNAVLCDYDNHTKFHLTIHVHEGASCTYYTNLKNIRDYSLYVDTMKNSSFAFYGSIKQEVKGNLTLEGHTLDSNASMEINTHVVTDKEGEIKCLANGVIPKDVKDISFLENIRVIALNDSDNQIIPNLLVDSSSVEVNHNATIGSVDQDSLHYLMSKGLSEETSTKLLVDGFLNNQLKGLKEGGGVLL